MSVNVALFCPHCCKYTDVFCSVDSDFNEYDILIAWDQGPGRRWWIGACRSCNEPMLILNKGETVYPSPQPMPVSDNIKEPAKKHLTEAKKCFIAGAFNACAVMSRKAIESAAKDILAKDDFLVVLIDRLKDEGIIAPRLHRAANAARFLGNAGAHADENDITMEEAQQAMNLAERILESIYDDTVIIEKIMQTRGPNSKK